MSLKIKLPEGMQLANFGGINLPIAKHEVTVKEFGIQCYAKHTDNPLWRGKLLGYVKDSEDTKLLPGTVYPVSVVKLEAKNKTTVTIPLEETLMNTLEGAVIINVFEKIYNDKVTGKEKTIKVAELSI